MSTAAIRKKQTGAVTLMGALFIIITIALVALAANRMAGSNIIDTAMQNDSVEALFIAETGIEYASYFYANGTACPDLNTTINNTVSGRGRFDVTGSSVNGTDCSITVLASVSSVGAGAPDASQRTIIADLRRNASATWAVGNGGTLFVWNGSSWIEDTSTPTSEDLLAVHCVTSNECWAVGKAGVILHYLGGTWTLTVLNTNEEYRDIDCAPNNPGYCFVVGKDGGGVVRFWNGSSWSAPVTTSDELQSVSCPTTTCYAVGKKNDPVLRFNGSSWVSETNNFSDDLNGVHCYSATECWAVGQKSGSQFTFGQRPGSSNTWNELKTSAGTNGRELNSVYCVASDDCWAVGKKLPGNSHGIVHWNGSNWQAQFFGSGDELKGISCSSANDCYAVGKNGAALHWDGSNWSDISTAALGGTELQSVSAIGGGGAGAVSLIRWHEQIINN